MRGLFIPVTGNHQTKYSGESILQIIPAYAIMPVGKRITESTLNTKGRTPGSTANTSGGSPSFSEKATAWAWLPSIHLRPTTCICSRRLHLPLRREKKITEFPRCTPPSCHQYWGGNKAIISHLLRRRNSRVMTISH